MSDHSCSILGAQSKLARSCTVDKLCSQLEKGLRLPTPHNLEAKYFNVLVSGEVPPMFLIHLIRIPLTLVIPRGSGHSPQAA